jgi:hypothetical protein
MSLGAYSKTKITLGAAGGNYALAKIYGIRITVSDGTVTRVEDAVGLTFNAHAGSYNSELVNDFNTCYPWSAIRQVKTDSNGKILAYLGDNIYSEIEGEYYTRIPQFYFRDYEITEEEVDYRYVMISDRPLPNYQPAFLDSSGNKKPYGLYGRTPTHWDGSEMVTKPSSVTNNRPLKVSYAYDDFLTAFEAKGDGNWTGYDLIARHALWALSVVEAGSLDHKTSCGTGINSGMPYGSGSEYQAVSATSDANTVTLSDSPYYAEGMLVQVGSSYSNNSVAADRYITDVTDNLDGTQTLTLSGDPFSVSIGDYCVTWGQPVPEEQIDALNGESGYITQFGSQNRSHVSYRGIWDLWGNIWQWNYGFIRYDGVYYISTQPSYYNIGGTFDPRAETGWTEISGTGYLDNGYQKTRKPLTTNFGIVDYLTETGGGAGSSTFYAAYLYNYNSSYTGVRVLLVGGRWGLGSNVSPVCAYGHYGPGSSHFSLGARLIR